MIRSMFKKIFRRVVSAVLAVLMLVPLLLIAPEKAQAAPVVDGTTSAITIYRWKKISDPYTFFKTEKNLHEIFMTWTDNGQTYFFRYPLGDKPKNHWEGSAYDGSLVLTNNLLSSQPILKDVLDNGVTDFISETQMDCGLWFKIVANSTRFGVGSNLSDYPLSYERNNGTFVRPGYDDDYDMWLPFKNSDNTIRFESYIKISNKDAGTVLRHNGNKLYSSTSGSSDSTRFTNFYTIDPVEISAISKNYSIANGQVLPVDASIYIPKGVTLTVKNGGTLSVGGQLLNDGKIVVEKGGLVVVKEKAAIMPLTRNDTACGAFVSDGTVVVRKNAKLIGGGSTGLWFSSGGVTNFGMLASENFRATQLGIIENRTGGMIYAGKTIGTLQLYNFVCSYLDSKTPAANSTIAESTFQTKQPSGAVLLPDSAVINKGGTLKNFGSFGSADNPVVNVYIESDTNPGAWENVLMAFDSEMGYYQSYEMHVTTREYLDAIGTIDQLRAEYRTTNGSEEGFEHWLTEYCAQYQINLDSWLNVYNGVFTVNGKTSYIVPWYKLMRVTKGDEILKDDLRPWQVSAIWGDGARPDNLPDEFADAPLLDRTFFIELAASPGKWLEVAGGGTSDGDNVRIWSKQDANHMRWTFQKGEVLYRNGQKLYYYYIVNLNSGKVLHITSSTYAETGQNIRQNAKKSAPFQQLFRVEQNSDGTYRIIPRGNDSFSVETNKGGAANGSNVQVGVYGGNANRWNLIETEESPYVGKIFELEPVCAPGMRLEIKNGSTYYGSGQGNAQIGTYNPDAAHQRWRFDKAEIVYENGQMHYYYFLVPTQWKHQLTVGTVPPKNGTDVYQGQANGNTARQWRIVENDNGTVSLVPRTGASLMLNVAGGGSDPGTNVNVATAASDGARTWWIYPPGTGSHDYSVDPGNPETPENPENPEQPTPGSAYNGKTFELEPFLAPGMRLEIQDASTSTGGGLATLQLGNSVSGAKHQQFRFDLAESVDQNGESIDYYYIVALHSGYRVTIANLTPKSEDNVYQNKAVTDNPTRQQWRVIDHEDGTVSIAPRNNNELRINVYSGKNDPNTNVNVWSATGDALEKFWMLPAGSTPTNHSSQLPDLSGQVFELESAAAPGKVMEVTGGGTSYGGAANRVRLADDADMAHQRWRFVYAETVENNGERYDYYYLLADHSGHALMPDSTNAPTAGAYVLQYKLGLYPNCEKWRLADNGDGTYGLVTKTAANGGELRLTLKDGGTDTGTQMITAAPDGSAAQAWKLNPVSRPTYADEAEPPRAEIENKTFEIESAAAPGMVVEVADAATAVNIKTQLGADANKTHQRWKFVFAETAGGHNYYYIVAVHSGHALIPDTCNGVRPDTTVIQYTLKRFHEFQKWRVVDNGDGTYGFVAKMSQGYFEPRLSLSGGGTTAGTEIITAENDGSDVQKWKLNPVE